MVFSAPRRFLQRSQRPAECAGRAAADVHDKHPLADLLHGNEQRMYGDSAYASQKDLIQGKAPSALDFTNRRMRKAGCEVDEVKKAKNRKKSKIRARVEHVFATVKLREATLATGQGTTPRSRLRSADYSCHNPALALQAADVATRLRGSIQIDLMHARCVLAKHAAVTAPRYSPFSQARCAEPVSCNCPPGGNRRRRAFDAGSRMAGYRLHFVGSSRLR